MAGAGAAMPCSRCVGAATLHTCPKSHVRSYCYSWRWDTEGHAGPMGQHWGQHPNRQPPGPQAPGPRPTHLNSSLPLPPCGAPHSSSMRSPPSGNTTQRPMCLPAAMRAWHEWLGVPVAWGCKHCSWHEAQVQVHVGCQNAQKGRPPCITWELTHPV